MNGFAMKDHRPWGSYTVLEERATYKVKRIEVLPGQRLSYQKHEKRAEHWMIVGGRASVTLNGEEVDLSQDNLSTSPGEQPIGSPIPEQTF